MRAFAQIRDRLIEPGRLSRGESMRLVGIVLNLAGALYAWAYAAWFAGAGDGWYVAGCGAWFAFASFAIWALPPKPIFATTSALLATAVISLILRVPDATATVPMFYLWPLVALAYFHSPKMLAVSVLWMAGTLAPVLVIGASPGEQVVYIGSVSIVTMLAVLIGLIRRDEHALRHSLEQSSSTDSLTGLLNRRAFAPAYAGALAAAKERGDGLSIVLIDLDHFKRYNDSHGHVTGDAALRRTADVLAATTEPGDLVARLGGEEFAVVLPGRGPAAAQRWCDRVAAAIGPTAPARPADSLVRAGIRATLGAQLRAVTSDAASFTPSLAAHDAPAEHATTRAESRPASTGDVATGATTDGVPPITSSFGVVHVSPGENCAPDALLGRADAALYAAKRGGRDRVGIWTDGGVMLGKPMHVDGELTVGEQPLSIVSPRAATGTVSDPGVVRARRARLMLHMTVSMILTGAANAFARGLLTPGPEWEQIAMLVTGGLLVACAGLVLLVGAREEYSPVESAIGILVISAVVALISPPITATFFYTWPIAMTAYFARPKVAVGMLGWLAVSLIAALALTHQPVDEVGVVAGALTNMVVLTSIIVTLRWREARLIASLEAAASIDPLTGARTRRAFIPTVEGWMRQGPGVALLLIDLDHFKRYNDRHGHLAGDDALRRAAAALHAAAPADGIVCRFGGEEFAIAFPTGGLAGARSCADAIAELLSRHPDALTASAGIAVGQLGESDLDRIVARADQALYAAKGAGRARVAWFASDSDEPLVVTEPIHVARPSAFGDGDAPLSLSPAA